MSFIMKKVRGKYPLFADGSGGFNQPIKDILDPDAQAFITATGITDETIIGAIDNLVIGLKDNNLWTKMKAVYPFVGGTVDTHKYNLKDPQDTNAAFRMQFLVRPGFSGSISHSSNGAQAVGEGYGDTNLNATLLTNNSTHISLYSRSSGQFGSDAGVFTAFPAGPNIGVALSRLSPGTLFSDQYNGNTNRLTPSNTDGRGFYVLTRTSSTDHRVYKNGSQIAIDTNTNTIDISTVNRTFFLWNTNPWEVGSNREFAFYSIGDGLDPAESGNLTTLVIAFQTTLGRNV